MPDDQCRLMPGGGLAGKLLTNLLCEKMNNLFFPVFYL
jgi:hypothetical protein